MKRPLDELLRDPRAHHDAAAGEAARRGAERAMERWRAEGGPAPAPVTVPEARRRPVRWQDLGLFAACATAAAVLLPMLWPALVTLGASVSASPLPWLAVAAAGLLATVPQLRELFDRVAAA